MMKVLFGLLFALDWILSLLDVREGFWPWRALLPRPQAPRARAVTSGEPHSTDRWVAESSSLPASPPPTLTALLQTAYRKYAARPFLGTRTIQRASPQKVFGKTEWLSYAQVDRRVASLSQALLRIGLRCQGRESDADRPDFTGSVVVIYLQTCADWFVLAQAVLREAMVIVPVSAAYPVERLVAAVNDFGASVVLADYHRVQSIASRIEEMPSLETLLYSTSGLPRTGHGPARPRTLNARMNAIRVASIDQAIASGAAADAQETASPLRRSPTPDDVAIIMSTSGTSSNPTRVMLTHRQILASVAAVGGVICREFDRSVGYLPLSHIFEFASEIALASYGGAIGYADPFELSDERCQPHGAFMEFKPTAMVGVPQVYERIIENVHLKLREAPPAKAYLFGKAVDVKARALAVGRPTPLLDRLVFRKLRARLGGAMRICVSGGGALSEEVQRLMRLYFGVQCIQGYGMTETAGVVTVQHPDDAQTGVCGPVAACSELRLRSCVDDSGAAETCDFNGHPYLASDREDAKGRPCRGRGEVCVRGANVMRGYYRDPQKTAATIDSDGWLRTGDIGQIRPDGSLEVIDRLKNIVKLKNGEYVCVAELERVYASSPWVAKSHGGIMVYADGDLEAPVALVQLDHQRLESWTRGNLPGGGERSLSELASSRLVKQELLRSLSRCADSAQLPLRDRLADVVPLVEPWTIENGCLTTTLKLARWKIAALHADAIALLKGRAPTAEPAQMREEDFLRRDWHDNVGARLATEGRVFAFPREGRPTVYHGVGREVVAAAFDEAKTDKAWFLGPAAFPEALAQSCPGSLFSNGAQHDRFRGWTVAYLRRSISRLSLLRVSQLVISHFRRWDALDGAELDVNRHMEHLAADLTLLLFCGREWPGSVELFQKFHAWLQAYATTGALPTSEEIRQLHEPFYDLFASLDIDGPADAGLTREEAFLQLLGTMVLATYPALSSSLASLFAEIQNNPGPSNKARLELRRNREALESWLTEERSLMEASAAGVFPELFPSIHACVLESFRLHPPVTFVSTIVNQDLELYGKKIPQGSVLKADLFHTARLAENTPKGKSPDVFDPERYLADPKPTVDDPSYVVFGLGAGDGGRRCPADKLMTVLGSLFGSLVLRFLHWDTGPGVTWRGFGHFHLDTWPESQSGYRVSRLECRDSFLDTRDRPTGTDADTLSTRVVVVGGGVSGLACAQALNRFGYAVTVLERRPELGGHACTKAVAGGRHRRDPAFGAFQRQQWPNLFQLLQTLGVKPLSLGRAKDFIDSSLIGWFARDGHELPLRSVDEEGRRFIRDMMSVIEDPEQDGVSLGEYLETAPEPYSPEFYSYFLLGRVVQFFAGHPLSHYLGYPVRLIAWMVLNNISPIEGRGDHVEIFRVHNQQYIRAFSDYLTGRGVRIIRNVTHIRVTARERNRLALECGLAGKHERGSMEAGALVLTVPPDRALEVLGAEATPAEAETLSGFEQTHDSVVVHRDARWLPKDRRDWKFFNIMLPDADKPLLGSGDTAPITTIEPCEIDGKTPIFATYAYGRAKDWEGECDKFTFSHTKVTPRTQRLRRELKGLQGERAVFFCGAWTRGLTLHEDALVSGYQVANRILEQSVPGASWSILPAAVPQPEPFGALVHRDGRRVFGSRAAVEAAVVEFLVESSMIPQGVALSGGTLLSSLQLSSLEFAILLMELNTWLSTDMRGQLDIAEAARLETIGALAGALWELLSNRSRAGEDGASGHPLRLLCLHGWRSNSEVMRIQMQKLFAGIPRKHALLEPDFLQAPNPALGRSSTDIEAEFDGPFGEWFYLRDPEGHPISPESLTKRRHEDFQGRGGEPELDRSKRAVLRALRQAAADGRRYDGLVGFSQGGSLVHALCHMKHRGEPEVSDLFDFAVTVAAPLPKHRLISGNGPLEKESIRVPSLHIYGTHDEVTPVLEAREAFGCYDSGCAQVLWHQEVGHVVPSLEDGELARLQEFLDSFLRMKHADMSLAG